MGFFVDEDVAHKKRYLLNEAFDKVIASMIGRDLIRASTKEKISGGILSNYFKNYAQVLTRTECEGGSFLRNEDNLGRLDQERNHILNEELLQ